MKKTLVILGMHRSGTSLVTQWLHRCGLNVGTHLLAGSTGNLEGHFEDEDFFRLHCNWLIQHHLPDSGLIDVEPSPLTKDEIEQAEKLLVQKSSSADEWGWKEPRTCLWLPTYRQLLPHACYFIVLRNFNDTVNSLVMRTYRIKEKERQQKVARKSGLSKLKWKYLKRKSVQYYFRQYATEYLKVWNHYHHKIIDHYGASSPEKCIFVNYEDLLQNDQQVFHRLANDWRFSLHLVPFKDIFKKELLSSTQNIDQYIKDKSVLDEARQIQEACNKIYQTQQL